MYEPSVPIVRLPGTVRMLWQALLPKPRDTYALTGWLFLRLLGVAYFSAFLSLSMQVLGLVGKNGLLPAAQFLELMNKFNVTSLERYRLFPTLLWLNSSDVFLQFLAVGGTVASLLLIVNVAPTPVLTALWVFYLSLVTVGQDFLAFQWDALLLETGFLAIFFAPLHLRPHLPRAQPPRIVLWLLRWLLFRLMFSSGMAKLASGDPTWAHLTALTYHYETQPLPTPVAWYAHQLPAWFHQLSVLGVFVIELGVPFLIFTPFRRARIFAAGTLIFLQVLIAVTGNYTFFNLLTVTLCILLLDDAFLRRFFPRGMQPVQVCLPPRRLWLTIPLALFILIPGITRIARFFLPPYRLPGFAVDLVGWQSPLRIVNSYGLFAVMTTSRPEIIIEGSNDGETWYAYDFRYKPGDLKRPPPWVAPLQPRLDWQMWFAALGTYEDNVWFKNLLIRLLQGTPEVLGLLEYTPFPDAPPRYIRAVIYDYRFTDAAARSVNGTWWRRGEPRPYSPILSLFD